MGENIPPLIIGIDEAGRGPVIGDLVIGIIGIEKETESNLVSIGVKDSKMLTSYQRTVLLKHVLNRSIFVLTLHITPPEIDASKNINQLLATKILASFYILEQLIHRYKRVEVYIDEIKGTKQFIERELSELFGKELVSFVMEPDADKKYIVVSAASIVAKTFRDQNLFFLKQVFGELGSGYPSDPKTRSWLINAYNTYMSPPKIVRRSWATLKSIAPKWYIDKRGLKKTKTILDFLGEISNGNESASRS